MGINVPLVRNFHEEVNLSTDPRLQLEPVKEERLKVGADCMIDRNLIQLLHETKIIFSFFLI